jgi:hypothetical protein
MTDWRWLRLVPVLALVLVTSAGGDCAGPATVTVCTQAGCVNGFSVTVDGQIPAPVTVTVSADDEARTFQCQPGETCRRFLEGWTPAQATVHVAWEGGDVTRTVSPEYETVYPNGRSCPPECLQASVVVSVQ